MTEHPVVGVVLAGGAGRRIGGDKATVELAGKPLVRYPVAVLRQVCADVAVVAKRDTTLPKLAGEADLWVEPDEPRHPLAGIVHALRTAAGRPILVLAGDMPCVPVALLRALMDAGSFAGAGAVTRAGGRLEPLCALYTPLALAGLAHFDPSSSATAVVEQLGVEIVDWPDADDLLSINAPEDLLRAQARLGRLSR